MPRVSRKNSSDASVFMLTVRTVSPAFSSNSSSVPASSNCRFFAISAQDVSSLSRLMVGRFFRPA